MTKFTIVTYIKNGNVESRAFSREDSTEGIDLFEKVRNEGYEAYLFHRPIPTKHCKSRDARESTNKATHSPSDAKQSAVQKIASKVGRKPSKQASEPLKEARPSDDAVDLS